MSIVKFLQSAGYKKELRSQLRLFIPFLLGQLCASGMGTVDTVMAGLAGTTEISGVAIGCSFYWPAYLFLSGMAYAVTPTVSHILPSKNFTLMEKVFSMLFILYRCRYPAGDITGIITSNLRFCTIRSRND